MTSAGYQLDLFSTAEFPAGFRYANDVITPSQENRLLTEIQDLPFKAFDFHGHIGNRRTVSFGWSYDFALERIACAPPIPGFLADARRAAAHFAGMEPSSFQQALVTEYQPGAGIGWHRDKGVFEEVVGISLASACRFRLRRRCAGRWERVNLDARPRSAYLLSGPARSEWEHSIPPVDTLRYSITFRRLRRS